MNYSPEGCFTKHRFIQYRWSHWNRSFLGVYQFIPKYYNSNEFPQGTATSLANGGPIGLLLGYMAVGTICYSVMVS